MRVKKQFRLWDVYRYAVTGKESVIEGILHYECTKNAETLLIVYADYTTLRPSGIDKFYFSDNEEQLKRCIRDINKRLGNCKKPGKKTTRRNKDVTL